MSAKHAVLGLVIERPGYGYELAQRLNERCAAWGWDRTGVYPALDQLERDEHIRRRTRQGRRLRTTGRTAPRLSYEATPEGEDFHRNWLYEATPLTPVRQELDLKILLSGPEFLPRLIDQTWAQEQQCINALKALTERTPTPGAMETWREAAVVLQRDAEMRLLRVRIEWLQDSRTVMQRIFVQSGDRRVR